MMRADFDPTRTWRIAALGLALGIAAVPALAQRDERDVSVPAASDPVEVPDLGAGGPDDGRAARKAGRPIAILQLGDSHTAADFFTGQIRRRLEAEFGDGGAGYVAPGRPHPGVRNSALRIEASAGWTYSSLQGAKDNRSQFMLSGFEAVATAPGETLTYTAERPMAWDLIEVETAVQPGGGAIAISLDGKVESDYQLSGPESGRIVLQLTPVSGMVERLGRIRITTKDALPVRITGLQVRNRAAGVSVSGVGFPGATIDILNRFDENNLRQELARIAPDVVVLAFGTNEGFNDTLDPAVYEASYRRALQRIRSGAPNARIVVVAPPNANRLTPGCKAEAARAACVTSSREPAVTGTISVPESDRGGKSCVWRTPRNLANVRDIQRRIADEEHLVFWNWADTMPNECGAHEWSKATPPLMADDHVHMTVAGYRQTAERIVPVLRSILARIQRRRDALPDD